jgi:ribosome-binding protein aMBF1 (putative translation factor)
METGLTLSKRRTSSRIRQGIDARFRESAVRDLIDRPDDGWIREIREALGMSTGQLAHRMGLTQSGVSRLEQSEISDKGRIWADQQSA